MYKMAASEKYFNTAKRGDGYFFDNFDGENVGTFDKRSPTSNLRWVPFFLKDNREKARSQSTCQR